ncbi:hypothetical protein K2173_028432 [Erythroxylum novogranatense]|uniref:CCHC-type domain-containing protein n=1 Tax=Erythroxylum novogranatense TaxID=1862640 RepID=A0AAV8U4J5_9ROSI|nr:hypothetical protein K2173_028432 [Erythroxylum novogranatense]
MDSPDFEGHLTKKGQTRKREDDQPPPVLSYRAAVTGSAVVAEAVATTSWPEDELVVVEDGDLTLDVGEQGEEVGSPMGARRGSKLLSHRVSFTVMSARLRSLWKPRGPLKIVDLDHDFFLARFHLEEDFLKVLTSGPWTMFGQVLAIQRWFPDFRPAQASISRAVVWIRIPNLPIARYHPKILSVLRDLVGTAVKIDEASLKVERGRFARLAVEVDLSVPLPSCVLLDGESLLITYEGLPPVCYTCGMIGHSPSTCPRKTIEEQMPQA